MIYRPRAATEHNNLNLLSSTGFLRWWWKVKQFFSWKNFPVLFDLPSLATAHNSYQIQIWSKTGWTRGYSHCPICLYTQVSRYLRSPRHGKCCHATATSTSTTRVRTGSKTGVTRGYSVTCFLACFDFVGFEELSTERSAVIGLVSLRAFQVTVTTVKAASHLRS